MLYQFTFSNFKSYRDNTIFDMQAYNIDEFKDNLLINSKNGTQILPISAVYGPNGGGKSGLLEALVCLISIIIQPKRVLSRTLNKNNKHNGIFAYYTDCIPYEFDKKTKNEPTKFEIYFSTEKSEYRYILNVFKSKIIQEHLYKKDYNSKKPTKIFERYEENIELGDVLKKEKLTTSVNEKIPYLTFLSITNKIDIIEDVIGWFENVVAMNYANTKMETTLNIANGTDKKLMLSLFKEMDIDICDYRIEKEEKEDKTILNIFTKHKIDNEEYELDLYNESEGTKKLFGMLPNLLETISSGGLAIIDELDAKLHPKLLSYIIALYKNKKINTKNAQLIFTSHDLTTMNNKTFRRDEIWFACKNEEKASQIYSLYEIRDEKGEHIRANAAYNKQYIEGKYGADPYLTKILNWEV